MTLRRLLLTTVSLVVIGAPKAAPSGVWNRRPLKGRKVMVPVSGSPSGSLPGIVTVIAVFSGVEMPKLLVTGRWLVATVRLTNRAVLPRPDVVLVRSTVSSHVPGCNVLAFAFTRSVRVVESPGPSEPESGVGVSQVALRSTLKVSVALPALLMTYTWFEGANGPPVPPLEVKPLA